MGGTVLERLATLETEMTYVRKVVDSTNDKLDKLTDLVDVRITAADTRREMLTSFGRWTTWGLAGLAGVLGGGVGKQLAEWAHHIPIAG